MEINLEYYKVFYYVANCKSISLAAEQLCISQPAVSQSIKLLEKHAGCSLFLRLPKGVRLTPEGEVLYKYVKEGYEKIEKGEEALKRMIDVDSGEIRIGASDMTLQYYLLPYLEKFHEVFPKIKIKVANAPTPETLTSLYEHNIDFAVVSTPFIHKEQVKIKKVKEINSIFVAGNEYKKYKEKTNNLSELIKLPLICLEKKTSTRRAMDEFLKENDIVIEPEFELATSEMVVQFASRNLGIGCVVKDFAISYIKNGSVFEVKFDKEQKKREFCVVTYDNNPISLAAKKLIDMLESEII